MARSDRHIRNSTFAVGFTLALGIFFAWMSGWLEGTEAGLYDVRAKRFQKFSPKPSDKIVHVDIDDATLEAVGAWPWPRTQMADIIDEIARAGAKAIVLDILYTEPQEIQYVRSPDGKTFTPVDHDANLAASFGRAGNVLVPASLSFVSARAQSTATTAAVKTLAAQPETTLDTLMAGLKAQGKFTAEELTEVESIFFTLRREAVLARVEDEMDQEFGGHGHRHATTAATSTVSTSTAATGPAIAATQPTTAATTQPAPSSQPTSPKFMPTPAQAEALQRKLMLRLFPSLDPNVESPQLRLVREGYDRALAERHLDGFTRQAVPGVAVFQPRSEIHPVHTLLGAAASSAYVDYPNFGDGTVRSVPLFMAHKDRWLPQMGLRTACTMLDVNPEDLIVTQDSVIIPAGTMADGTPRAERVIPVRTETHSFTSGRSIEMPLMMDIPWFGPGRWYAMYDPDRPNQKAQHLSMALLYGAAETRSRIQRNSQKVDEAIFFLLSDQTTEGGIKAMGLDMKAAKAHLLSRPPLDDLKARAFIIQTALQKVEATKIVEEFELIKPEERTKEERDQYRELTVNIANLKAAATEAGSLQAQLDQQRSELKSFLTGKAAILGWTAVAAVADQKPTPLHAAAPGVVVHGVIVNAILANDFWQTARPWVNGLLIILFGLITSVAVARLSPVVSLVTAVLLAAGYVLFNCVVLFDYGNWLVELAAPLLAVAGPWAGGTITRLVIETREKARITRRLGSYVDQDLVQYCLESRDETIFTGQERETTVVFTDLEGFTKLSDKLKKAVVPILNDYMGRATVVIKKHKGFVNKFLGDGILFFFNAPRPNVNFVENAMDCLLDLQVMMKEFNVELVRDGHSPLKMRAGMTTAKVIAGDAGSKDHADYTVLGDDVNLSARLESANKFFGTLMLVTDVSMQRAGDRFLFRPVGNIQVSGRSEGVMTYEPLAWIKDATDEEKELARRTDAVYTAFAADKAADCLAAVEAMEKAFGESKLTKTYRKMCEAVLSGEEPALPKQIVLSEK
ncbi:CHASE2 domain-containing protein [Humisphaera borealis]|uniref:CHASE2 domain-containing protein n=1 Tax=Humisphaera borealis TaxID=2807512 RepID=A0A7M2X2Z6_9BACT|nr:CHASE2 domain-containing protein [Humisphaera borealis]QOV91802.1 CHASE2 domain-containing protein [Humisphaera borealis]